MFRLLDEALQILEWTHANGGSIRFREGQENEWMNYYGTLQWLCNADPIMLRRIPDYAAKQLGCVAVYELTAEGRRQFEQ